MVFEVKTFLVQVTSVLVQVTSVLVQGTSFEVVVQWGLSFVGMSFLGSPEDNPMCLLLGTFLLAEASLVVLGLYLWEGTLVVNYHQTWEAYHY